MELRTARLEAALRSSSEWQAASTIDELAGGACASLGELIPCDGSGWNEVDLRGRQLRVVAWPGDYFPTGHDRLAELLHENPLVAHRAQTRGAAHTFSDFLGVREFHRRAIYGDVYRGHGVEDQLAAMVEFGRDVLVAVAFNRGARTFTRADRQLLDLLRPHLARAYRTVAERAEARALLAALERGLESAGRAVAVLERDGRVAEATAQARRLLLRWFGHGRPEPGTHVRGDAELVVRRLEGDPPLLVLRERRLAPDPARARELGLTRREAQVVGLAGRGLTNAQIAAELVVSPRTVQKHLEHAFGKLGVHARADAARLLLH